MYRSIDIPNVDRDDRIGSAFNHLFQVVLQTENGYFLKFPLNEIPEKKKSAAGVRGIKLEKEDKIAEVYLIPENADISIDYKGKEVSLKKLKTAKRDGKGTKLRA